TLLALALVASWAAAAARAVASPAILAWAAAAAVAIALAVATAPLAARWAIPLLAAAAFVPVPPRLRNIAGAYVLVGVPWLALVLAGGIPIVGSFRLYEFGNDFWMYQRYGYRIVMQGYWLEGGSHVFYFQPL